MIRRLGALAAAGVVALGVAAATGASVSAAPDPTVSVSTSQVVPGQPVTVTGTGWPDQTRVQAALCGNEAVGGTADCANTSTAAMSATQRGLLWGQIAGAIPPVPCPCVVLVTADSLGYSRTIPVTVEGASTAPVSSPKLAPEPTVRIASLHVYGTMTLASAMGASSLRTVEFQISNPGTSSATPVLFGYWGRGSDPTATIRLPRQTALAPGKSRTIQATFEVAALSVGTYTVKVQVQLVGYSQATAATTFGQWPIGLLALAAVVLLVILYLLARSWGRRRARRRGERRQALIRTVPPAPDSTPSETGPLSASSETGPAAAVPRPTPAEELPSR